MANLHITLELKNDDGMATEETLMIPPFGLNTLGIDMQNHDVDPLITTYDLPLYTQVFLSRDRRYPFYAEIRYGND